MKTVYQQSTISLGATTNTTPLDISLAKSISLQIVATTNANTGQFSLQGSNDGTNFKDLTVAPTISPLAGANIVILTAAVDVPYKWCQLKFTIGTGTNGSAVVTIHGKG